MARSPISSTASASAFSASSANGRGTTSGRTPCLRQSKICAALAQILLWRKHGVRPEVVPLPLAEEAENADADAVLLIGDRAMRACLPGFAHAYDLGQE